LRQIKAHLGPGLYVQPMHVRENTLALMRSVRRTGKASRRRHPDKLVELIRKLHWIGEDVEARKLEGKLHGASRCGTPLGKVLTMQDAVLYETD